MLATICMVGQHVLPANVMGVALLSSDQLSAGKKAPDGRHPRHLSKGSSAYACPMLWHLGSRRQGDSADA